VIAVIDDSEILIAFLLHTLLIEHLQYFGMARRIAGFLLQRQRFYIFAVFAIVFKRSVLPRSLLFGYTHNWIQACESRIVWN
jgi:hypothetical protein